MSGPAQPGAGDETATLFRRYFPPLHPEGWRFVPIFALATLILFWIWTPLGWIGVALTLWCAYFFRDPERVTPSRPGILVSPADGFIESIGPAPPPPELGMDEAPRTRVSVFMSVLDVHVNRAPAAGKVTRLSYTHGKFLSANLDKASTENERLAVRLELASGGELAFVLIAGLIARRIRCDIAEGASLAAGARVGMIRFGSRVDVYLPPGVEPLVTVGQRTIGGETVLAEAGRAGEPAASKPKRRRARKAAAEAELPSP